MNNLTILIYYLFCICVIAMTGYVVFVLNHSGWWFLLAILFTNISPTIKNNSNK